MTVSDPRFSTYRADRPSPPTATDVTRIRVDAFEYGFELSKQIAPRGKVIFQTGDWVTATAQPAVAPAPIESPTWKTGVTGQILPGGHEKTCHMQLSFNSRPIGTFDAIPNSDARVNFGYPQPDGRVLIYAIDNDQLLRFYVP